MYRAQVHGAWFEGRRIPPSSICLHGVHKGFIYELRRESANFGFPPIVRQGNVTCMGFTLASAPIGAGELARRYAVPIQQRGLGADKIEGAQWANIGSTMRLPISPGGYGPPVTMISVIGGASFRRADLRRTKAPPRRGGGVFSSCDDTPYV